MAIAVSFSQYFQDLKLTQKNRSVEVNVYSSFTFQMDISIIMSKQDILESMNSLLRSQLFPKY